jgi:hypothetical protein
MQGQALKQGIEDLAMPLDSMGVRTGIRINELPT